MKLKQGLIVSALAVFALLVGVLPAVAQTTTQCMTDDDPVTGDVRANLVVPARQICVVEDATLTGNVTVGRNADLYVESSTINGNVVVERNGLLDVFDTAVNGSVRLNRAFGLTMETSGAAAPIISNNAEYVYLFDSDARSTLRVNGGEAFLEGARMSGDITTTGTFYTDVLDSVVYSDLSVSGSEEGTLLCGSEFDGLPSFMDNEGVIYIGADFGIAECAFNVMAGDIELLDNSADIQVDGNVIRGNVICEGNDPAPVIGENRLRGEGVGQCAADAETDTAAAADTEVRLFSSQAEATGVGDRHAELKAKIAERRAAAGMDEPTVEEKVEASEAQAEARAEVQEAEAAPAAPSRVEGRALPPRSDR